MPRIPFSNLPIRVQRPTPFVLAVTAVVATVAFVGLLTYYGSDEFSRRAADTRASNEAMSFAEHSSTLATGDAFDGYVQILRYADDPILSAFASTPNDRTAALQRLLYVNFNKFSSLTIVDRSSLILATTDSTIANVKGSTAFSETRANLGPANSDIILPEAGRPGYVEYSAPLRDPNGTIWGILLGRADPATLWKGTLAAAVDGSRNVIINSEGLFSAGVPDELLRQPWHGRPLSNGGVRANIAGVDSICGLAPIGKDTQIDRGLNVASCLPVSLIQIEAHSATDKQGLITIAGVILAIVLASLALKFLIGGGSGAAEAEVADEPAPEITPEKMPALEGVLAAAGDEPATASVAEDNDDAETETFAAMLEPDAEPDGLTHTESMIVIEAAPPPDVDALTLIEAYEQRNAGLAERLRDTVQAKLLVAAIEADEAFKLAETDAETAAAMHAHAMDELETIRKRQLRSIGQELFPGLTRLGLPGAMKAMRKELKGVINVTLDIDATTDSVGGGASRSSVSPALRLVMYRFALDAVRALAVAGAETCALSLRRDGDRLRLAISCGNNDLMHDAPSADGLAASTLAIEAYAGSLSLEREGSRFVISLHVPAPAIEPGPDIETEVEEIESDEIDEPASSPIRQIRLDDLFVEDVLGVPDEDDRPAPAALPPAGVALAPRTGIAAALEALQAEFFGSMIVALDIVGDFDDAPGRSLADATIGLIQDVVRETLRALQAGDARNCDISLIREGDDAIVVHVLSQTEEAAFESTHIHVYADALGEMGVGLSIVADGDHVEISIDVSLPGIAAPEADSISGPDADMADANATASNDGAQHAA